MQLHFLANVLGVLGVGTKPHTAASAHTPCYPPPPIIMLFSRSTHRHRP